VNIPFTQHLRPDGRERPLTVDAPTELEAEVKTLLEAGVTFNAEVLRTEYAYNIALYAEKGADLLAMELCPNEPSVHEALKRLITQAVTTLNIKPT
jgi:hypothetical protein